VSAAARVVVSGVSHRFGPRRGLEAVSFDVAAPGVLAVTGANGSGKSTLLRILAGLLRPTTGSTTLELAGKEVPRAARRRHVGLASPELAFYEELTARENLAFAATARGMANVHSAVNEALGRTGLAARAADLVAEFSSGMKQRLRLAFAVLHRPRILLLDEPGSHLDAGGREVVERLVQDACADGLVVLATNDPTESALARERIELSGRGLDHPA